MELSPGNICRHTAPTSRCPSAFRVLRRRARVDVLKVCGATCYVWLYIRIATIATTIGGATGMTTATIATGRDAAGARTRARGPAARARAARPLLGGGRRLDSTRRHPEVSVWPRVLSFCLAPLSIGHHSFVLSCFLRRWGGSRTSARFLSPRSACPRTHTQP